MRTASVSDTPFNARLGIRQLVYGRDGLNIAGAAFRFPARGFGTAIRFLQSSNVFQPRGARLAASLVTSAPFSTRRWNSATAGVAGLCHHGPPIWFLFSTFLPVPG